MAHKHKGFWYRSRRMGRKVVTEYLGAGVLGAAAAALDAAEMEERALAREAEKAEREAERAVDAQADAAAAALRAMVWASLILNGYHRHKGQWRLRHD